jgi:hypothetical protein
MVLLLSMLLLLLLHVAQVRFQAIKARAPDVAVGLQPYVKLVEGLGAQLVDALLSDRMRFDEPGFAECAEMFGDLRLMKPKPCGDFSHRTGAVTQELDNVQPVRFGQST